MNDAAQNFYTIVAEMKTAQLVALALGLVGEE